MTKTEILYAINDRDYYVIEDINSKEDFIYALQRVDLLKYDEDEEPEEYKQQLEELLTEHYVEGQKVYVYISCTNNFETIDESIDNALGDALNVVSFGELEYDLKIALLEYWYDVVREISVEIDIDETDDFWGESVIKLEKLAETQFPEYYIDYIKDTLTTQTSCSNIKTVNAIIYKNN
ncbi:hypothetical protein SAMN02745248_00603 [Hathewaya proteolytica DSM 3090]|uniref:Uncharacterized protein n=1 Tax=Hathewaya proteolytica DSM 3090 TaxID=1121331 RepID=A0A1M6L326_9CLOT|nr:hypothetical protein [Hathewaya proteolytica]SHJ65572.1 hypothetical protein SAMN02745248_00603 [Hathewaya proteolytica DSM 3090]